MGLKREQRSMAELKLRKERGKVQKTTSSASLNQSNSSKVPLYIYIVDGQKNVGFFCFRAPDFVGEYGQHKYNDGCVCDYLYV